MNIVYAGNKNVFDGLLISVLSIIEYNQDPLTVYVLTMDIPELDDKYVSISQDDLQLIETEMKKVNQFSQIVRVDVRNIFDKKMGASKNLVNMYTPYALLRLLLDEIDIIPDKVLYLDTDTVANQNIRPLYDINIEKYELAGSQDRYARFFFVNPFYVNTGVLLLNMKMIRQTKVFDRVVELLNRKKVFLSDQTGINKMARKKKIIARKYNEQKRVKTNTVIRHFSMQFRVFPKFRFVNIKPWHIEKVHAVYKCHEFDHILQKYQVIKLTKE